MFKIFGKYQGKTEEIDSFDTLEEAEKMLSEYILAYGAGWNLWIKAQGIMLTLKKGGK